MDRSVKGTVSTNSTSDGAVSISDFLAMIAIARFQVGDRVTATCGSKEGCTGRVTKFHRGKLRMGKWTGRGNPVRFCIPDRTRWSVDWGSGVSKYRPKNLRRAPPAPRPPLLALPFWSNKTANDKECVSAVASLLWSASRVACMSTLLCCAHRLQVASVTGALKIFSALSTSSLGMRVAMMLPAGIDVNATTQHCDDRAPNSGTALAWACELRRIEVARLLLAHKDVDVNFPGRDGWTALDWACRLQHIEMVNLLIDHKNIKINRGLIKWACQFGHIDLAKKILDRKQIDIGDISLRWSCRNGHIGTLDLLLSQKGIDVNLPDSNGETALAWACACGRIELVKKLLGHDAISLNVVDKQGKTPLCHAVSWPKIKSRLVTDVCTTSAFLVCALRRTTQTNAFSAMGCIYRERGVMQTIHRFVLTTQESLAADRLEVIRLLLNRKECDVNLGSPLAIVMRCASGDPADTRALELLLTRQHNGLDVNAFELREHVTHILRGDVGVEMLEVMVRRCADLDVMRLHGIGSCYSWRPVGEHGRELEWDSDEWDSDESDGDSGGFSALHSASLEGNIAVVKILLSSPSCDVNHGTRNGITPLSLSRERGHREVIALLERAQRQR